MNSRGPKDLLLSPELTPQEVTSILAPYGFKETNKADGNLQVIADDPRNRHLLADIIEELLEAFSKSADPDQALNYFERFVKTTYNKTNLFSYLITSPYTLWLLAKLLSSSPFLSEILIRNPTYLYWIAEKNTLEKEKSPMTLQRELGLSLKTLKSYQKKIEFLCIFRRKELLRIGVRELLKKASVQKSTKALSVLAETVLQEVYEICNEAMKILHGKPSMPKTNGGKRTARFTILGMGKLGGEELNFSSDIDLIYLYEGGDGKTTGNKKGGPETKISNHEYFRTLSQKITSALTGITNEGYLYRVDLRLRPEGRSGAIANTLKATHKYYETRGTTWERLALLKIRPVGGDLSLGRQFIKKISPFVFKKPFSVEQLGEVKILKDKIDHAIKRKGETRTNLKLGRGGIREIEFIVQALQIYFASKGPKVFHRNTLTSLKKLLKQNIIKPEVFERLYEAYIFLRKAEHSLQMVHEGQTHHLPKNPTELNLCALRLDYRDEKGVSASTQFLQDYQTHTERVHGLFQELFYSPRTSPIIQDKTSPNPKPS